ERSQQLELELLEPEDLVADARRLLELELLRGFDHPLAELLHVAAELALVREQGAELGRVGHRSGLRPRGAAAPAAPAAALRLRGLLRPLLGLQQLAHRLPDRRRRDAVLAVVDRLLLAAPLHLVDRAAHR